MKRNALLELDKPIIGMLHLNGATELERLRIAKKEIRIMQECGVDAVMVEDYFGRLKDVENVLRYLASKRVNILYGVNVLRQYYKEEENYETAYRLAHEYGASFIQKDSVAGHLNLDDENVFIKRLKSVQAKYYDIPLLGGVRFKYQPYNSGRTLEEDLLLGSWLCDAIVVTGEGTGMETDIEKIKSFRNILGEFPLIIGAGLTPSNSYEQLLLADGAIVGSYIKTNHSDRGMIEENYVKELMLKVKENRR